jgi:NAD(P)-dependent dehydrogenase (short-subunit alcohol dehydrogenase family)
METIINRNYMEGKVCLVTGATSGIGKVTATALAAQGAEVIITGRDREKSEVTTRQIKAQTGNEAIQYLLADFSDLEQVRKLALTYKERVSRLDVLVNNAGSFFNTRRDTQYGVEMTFLVNHLAPFLLTSSLLDIIQDSAPARIINVSSDAHRYGSLDFDDLCFRRGYVGMKAYARSKLANILFSYELVRRFPGSGMTVNALHPGHVATDIWRTNFSFIGPALKRVMGLFALSPEEGADNTIYLASSPEVIGVSGKYFVKREPVESSPLSYDQDIAKKLWETSENLTSFTRSKPGIQHQNLSMQSGA